MERKKKVLLEGRGPVLLDTITYRISGHSPSDASSYRTKEEVALWEEVDCIKGYEEYLISNKVMTEKMQMQKGKGSGKDHQGYKACNRFQCFTKG